MSLRMQRANFLVADMDRALAFYRDVLGFEVAFVKEPRAKSYSHDVFDIDRATRVGFAALSTPGQPRVMALTEVAGLKQQPSPRRSAIVVECSDIDGVLERAQAHGFQAFPEEKLVTHDGRTGREVGVLDADGNLTVLYCILTVPEAPA
ncbi:MAG: VOC family protein [Gammaproteobacteria bacterium]|nr:VOC family protein [Gammaproteobacteria bacterium]